MNEKLTRQYSIGYDTSSVKAAPPLPPPMMRSSPQTPPFNVQEPESERELEAEQSQTAGLEEAEEAVPLSQAKPKVHSASSIPAKSQQPPPPPRVVAPQVEQEKKQAPAAATPSPQPTAPEKEAATTETSDSKFEFSSQELLRRLTQQSQTSHLLAPKSMTEMAKVMGSRVFGFMKNLPVTTARITVKLFRAIGRGAIQFVKQPSVAFSWWEKIVQVTKKEAVHYWNGSKLLFADTRYATRLVLKVLQGYSLSRRERIMVRVADACFSTSTC